MRQIAAVILIVIGLLVALNDRNLARVYVEEHHKTVGRIFKTWIAPDTRYWWIAVGILFALVGLGMLSGFLK